ncbi:MAG: stage III sporulation protein AB [Oscillospiraceae bacterium]|nr:stage III sporulation protein AB [Oscillospiraceae bacterium]
MKLFGIWLLFAGCAGAGFYAGHQVRRHIKEYHKILYFLEDCEILLRYQNLTLEELFHTLAGKEEYIHFDFLQRLDRRGEIPERLWKEALKESSFTGGAVQALEALGSTLGKSDLQGQLKALELCRGQIKHILKETQKTSQQKSKLYPSLGVLGGAMLVILFL